MNTPLLSLLFFALSCTAELNSLGQEIYGFDNSWAMMSTHIHSKFGDKQRVYDEFMDQCRHAAGANFSLLCDEPEKMRIRKNRFQTAGMRNYTDLGFVKVRTPEKAFSIINKFWEDNKNNTREEYEKPNPYHNIWEAPSDIVDIFNQNLTGGGPSLQSMLWDELREIMEEWTGQHLSPCSVWGIRIYPNQSVIPPHVDRNPLVVSAIINVDQDVDEDWMLEMWGHDGKPYNISMRPGDMVLYESSSTIHGRPCHMRGRFYANIFVHFEPIGALTFSEGTELGDIILDQEGQEAMEHGLPPYIIPGGQWEADWREKNPRGWQLVLSDLHAAARSGDFWMLKNVAIQNPRALHEPDDNGWQPIHEAARAGRADVVKFLLDAGADVNELTHSGEGYSPLTLAKESNGEEHSIIKFLESYGGMELGPDL